MIELINGITVQVSDFFWDCYPPNLNKLVPFLNDFNRRLSDLPPHGRADPPRFKELPR